MKILLINDYCRCLECAQIKFCSSVCRDIAWSSYHWLECGWLDVLHEIGIAHLALRVLLVTDLMHIISNCFILCLAIFIRYCRLSGNKKNCGANTIFFSEHCFCEHTVTARNSSDGKYGTESEEAYHSDYSAVYNLVTHREKILEEDAKQYELVSKSMYSVSI